MKRIITTLLLLASIHSMWALNISYRVYDYSIHQNNGRIYLGGKFAQYLSATRNNLAATDLDHNLLSWAPSVFHNTNSNLSRVNSIVADTNAVFIGGPFSHVNSNPRARLAKLDLITGNTLPWNPVLSNGINAIIDVNDMVIFKNQLIIADKNQSIHIVNKNTGVQMKMSSLPISMNQTYNSKLYLLGDLLFVASSFNMEIYLYKLVPSGDSLNVLQQSTINTSVDFPWTHEYVDIAIQKLNAATSILYIQLGQQHSNFPIDEQFKADVTVSLTVATQPPYIVPYFVNAWQANLLDVSSCGAVPCYCNPLPVINQVFVNAANEPYFSGVKFYNGKLLLTGYRIGKNPSSCSFPPNHLSNWFNAPTSTFSIYDSLVRDTVFNAPEGFARNLTIYNGRVYYIGARQDISGDNLFDEIGAMCIEPAKPTAFTIQPNPVCRGKSYKYAVPLNSLASGFLWSYSGSGATIIGNGNDTIQVLYGINATPGVLSVKTISECGFLSTDSLKITISFFPKPDVNAGTDLFLTCSTTQVQLNGTSSTPGATYKWYFSTGDSIAIQNPMRTIGGTEILKVTETVNGCINFDTMQVLYDTLPISVVPYTGNTSLTCLQNSISLNASGLYSGAVLQWTGVAFSSSDPASVVNPGSYLLSITSVTNGCLSYDTVIVTTNYVFPSVSPPLATDTLTCNVDSVLLGGATSTPSAILLWEIPGGDTLTAPAYGTQGGGYTVIAIDTSNGCSSNAVFVVQTFYTLPHVELPLNTQLNCSYNSVALNGYSLTPGASLIWNGPFTINASNGVIVSDTGQYVLSVTHPENGCSAADTFQLVKTNELEIDFGGDTTICNGSPVSITAQPIGGSPLFTYSWSSGLGSDSAITVAPTDTSSYSVTINDAAGCVGNDTVWVNVPDLLSDSTVTFQPCDPNSPSGQIQVFMNGGVFPYQYSSDTGVTWQSSPVITGLPFGNYLVMVEDAIGCTHSLNATISTSSATASANFLVNTSSYLIDTFVVVDISNPRPDTIIWDFPAACTIINADVFAPHVIYTDTGSITITMHAFFGTCELIKTKTISVFPTDTTLANEFNDNGIKRLVVYPNPNDGIFTYEVEFYKKQDHVILVYDNNANELYRFPVSESDYTTQQVTLSPGVTGSFILKVIAEYDAAHEIIIVNE